MSSSAKALGAHHEHRGAIDDDEEAWWWPDNGEQRISQRGSERLSDAK